MSDLGCSTPFGLNLGKQLVHNDNEMVIFRNDIIILRDTNDIKPTDVHKDVKPDAVRVESRYVDDLECRRNWLKSGMIQSQAVTDETLEYLIAAMSLK